MTLTRAISILVVVGAVAACGDDSAATTTAPTSPSLTTLGPATTNPPSETTTSVGTTITVTTSAAPTTTQSTGTTTTTTTTLTPVTVAPTTSGAPGPTATLVDIVVANGEVKGPGTVRVAVGEPIQLTVTADVADEVHLDGYDLFADVAPGQPAVLVFEARITGSFRLELSAARLELLRLEVA